jgi:ectoine hydroxylase-related dioxygenase (phytanoyl-CoA dioxygenase family)
MLRKAVYHLKRALHGNPALYRYAYLLASFNLDYLRQQLSRARYPSSFGGMWTDRDDFSAQIDKRKPALTGQNETLIRLWRENGFIKLPQVIEHELIDAYLQDIESIKRQSRSPLLITAATLPEPTRYHVDAVQDNLSVRIVDDYFFSTCSRRLLFHPTICSFLNLVFDKPPLLTQSLRFDQGSQQAMHQDTAFVRMNSPMKLAAVWIALEDIQPGSGELTYYPGSHHWEGFLFSGSFKHYDEERDGPAQLQQWLDWIHAEAQKRGVTAETFCPKRGDILLWHAALAHGGAAIEIPGLSRRSLVGHYCPVGVRPLYHYYKPAQRKVYVDQSGGRYTTSYYRGR